MKAISPQTLDWMATAPAHASRSRVIAAPIARVWEEIADHEGWPRWFGPISKIERIGSGEGVGSGRRVFLRGGLKAEEEFLAWEPEARFAFTITATNAPGIRTMVEDLRLEAIDAESTKVTYAQALEPAGARFAAPVLARLLPKGIEAGLKGLAELLES